MYVKEVWSECDFEQMTWHDNYLHAVSFPNENLELILDIDYLFKWVLDEDTNLYKFWVSPCDLIFFNVINLEINLDLRDSIGIDILNIEKRNPRLSPNGKITLWDFGIFTDKGFLKFESSGYNQIVKKQPVFNQSQKLNRVKF